MLIAFSDCEASKGKLSALSMRLDHKLTFCSIVDGDHLPQSAHTIIDQTKILSSLTKNGRDFLVTDLYGQRVHSVVGDAYVQSIFEGLHDLH